MPYNNNILKYYYYMNRKILFQILNDNHDNDNHDNGRKLKIQNSKLCLRGGGWLNTENTEDTEFKTKI